MKVSEEDFIFCAYDGKVKSKASDIINLVTIKELKDIILKTGIDTSLEDVIHNILNFNKIIDTELYFGCPTCFHFSNSFDCVNPLEGWDNLFHKYRKQIVIKYLLSEYGSSRQRERSLRRIVWNLIGNEIDASNFENDEHGITFTCPHCGEKLKITKKYDDFEFGCYENTKCYHLDRNKDWYYLNTIPYYYEIFAEKENMVTVSLIVWHLFPNIHGKMHIESSNHRATFNIATGMSYFFRETDMKTKKPIYEKSQRIVNATYGTYINDFQLPFNIFQKVYHVICEKKHITPFPLDMFSNEKAIGMSQMALLNRIGVKGHDFFADLYYLGARIDKKYRKKFYTIDEKSFSKVLKKKNIKNKKLISLFANNPFLFLYYDLIQFLGFKNYDIIVKLLENSFLLRDVLTHSIEYYSDVFSLSMYSGCVVEAVRTFFMDYFEFKSEAELYKKLPNDYHLLKDTCKMYQIICKKVQMVDDLKKVLFKGSFNEMHNRMMTLTNFLNDEGYYIPYEKEELIVNGETSNYYFELAKTSNDMRDVGNKMHICVGSYAYSAYQKECIIVFMKNKKTNVPEVCIELSPDRRKLIQAKDYCNTVVKQEKRNELIAFLMANKIEFSSCSDAECLYGNAPEECFEHIDMDGYSVFASKKDFRFKKIELNPCFEGISLNINEDAFINNFTLFI